MRTSHRLVSVSVAFALSLGSATPVFASGDADKGTETTVSGNALPTTTAPPSLTADLLRTLGYAKGALAVSSAPKDAREKAMKHIDEIVARVQRGEIPSDAELRALKAEIDPLLNAGSTPPQQTTTTTAPRSTTTAPRPSTTAPLVQNLVAVLEEALRTLQGSSLPAEKKAEFQKKLTALLEKAKKNDASPSDVEYVTRALRTALTSGGAAPAPAPAPSSAPSTSPGRGSDAGKGSDSGKGRTSLPPTQPSSPSVRPGGSPAPSQKPSDDSHSDSAEEHDSTQGSSGSASRGSDERFSRPTTPLEAATQLAAQLVEVRTKLAAMPPSDAQTALLATLDGLSARLTAGTAVAPDEVRAFFDSLRSFVEQSSGRKRTELTPTEPSKPSDAQMKARILGAITEAISHLGDLATPEAIKARDAMTALKTRIDSGSVVGKDEFEAALELVKLALRARPGARQAISLAGVIAQVQASSAPDDVKQAIIQKLQAAQDNASAHPETDATEEVKRALEEARAVRIAAAVSKIGSLALALKDASTALGNSDAALLAEQVLAALAPVDGSLPTKEALHEVHETLRAIIEMLAPAPSTTTTTPDTASDTTTPPSESTTTTASPVAPSGIPVRP